MKVSRTWVQKYFTDELPSAEALAEALTFHAFEIEEVVGEMLDVKVLPDRACYALSHRGIAKEISAILKLPLKYDPLTESLPERALENVTLTIDTDTCRRHMAAWVRGVKVGPSPEWLRTALESVGQRSINNIVDATNYVTLNMGQPVHAFDAAKIPTHTISVRETLEGESVKLLTGEEYQLPEGTMVLAEGPDGAPLDVAGIKGGAESAVNEATTELLVSVANFDGTAIRRTAQALKLWTDASLRFQNKISPELVAYGMRDVLALIADIAGGEVAGFAEVYPNPVSPRLPVAISVSQINGKLGSSFSAKEVEDALTRLGLPFVKEGETLSVTAPFVRGDIQIPEDLVEEVGRILGYDRVPETQMPEVPEPLQAKYRGIELIKDILLGLGFTEVSTPSFSVHGDILLSNPLQEDKPYLRAHLAGNMQEALVRAGNVAPRVLGPKAELRLFELGTVFPKSGERLSLVIGGKNVDEAVKALAAKGITGVSRDQIVECDLSSIDLEKLGAGYEPDKIRATTYQHFSHYPFALRDVAVWTPAGTTQETVAALIREAAGPLLVRLDLFDSFSKEEKTSYAFRLVLEAEDRTLTDTELNEVMGKVSGALNSKEGYAVR